MAFKQHRGWLCGGALFLLGTACGSEKSHEEQPESPASVADSMGDATELGGIDSAGSADFVPGNTSPDGPVVTTLGDFMLDVRSRGALTHYFDRASNRLFLSHGVETRTGEIFTFQFDYAGGNDSFSISDLGDYRGLKERNGFFMITENGRQFIARTGTVSIESMDGANITVTLEGLGVIPFDPFEPEDLSELREIGGTRSRGDLRFSVPHAKRAA